MEGDGFSLFLDLVGSGRGPGARARRWSAIVFILMLLMGGFAVYLWLAAVPRTGTAAEFEAGLKGSSFRYRTRSKGLGYEISGYLLDSEAVTITQDGSRWIYAPLVSEPGSGRSPRIYFAATEPSYRRARAEHRYIGILKPYVVPSVQSQLEAAGVSAAYGALFLEDSGTLRAATASAISLLVFALVGALASLFVFLMAARRARDDYDHASLASRLPTLPSADTSRRSP